MSKYPTNQDDVIDSRDVVKAIVGAYDRYIEACEAENLEPHSVELWAVHGCPDGPLGSLDPEMVALVNLAKHGEDYSEDWEYGAILIRDSYFVEYAQELADDVGALSRYGLSANGSLEWPYYCIDWELAARELQHDYSAVDFDGVTYWVR